MPLRVALLSPTLMTGGAERWMISLARCCDPRRIEWTGTVLTAAAPADPALCREMSAFMPVFAAPGPAQLAPHVLRWASERAALEAATADADVLVTWGVPNLAPLLAGCRIPVVFVSHGPGEWTARSFRNSRPGATHFVAVSEAALGAFTSDVRSSAVVIHNGIDVERATASVSRERMRAQWGFAPRQRLIGYVGRYSPEKNAAAAAQAAARLGGDYWALYAGAGWMEGALRAQVASVAGERARFVPMDRNVGNILSALDVFVLASPSEGFSLSLAEAWYCGVPTVATRVGAVPELERRHGPLVAPVPLNPSADELAGGVLHALSPAFRAEVVPRARDAVAEHYTARAMAARWTEYLESISRRTDLWPARSSP